ncbi:hypothetical protein Tco_1067985 [Tanacetum coccineum]|uniref:Uncharacterized protein n=1 Tax=Tanacetum coccineum TaxID=301880 RepID=A0ABQ5HEG7_9ASTR
MVRYRVKRKQPSLNIRQKPGLYTCCQNHMVKVADIEEKYHGPSDTLHNPPTTSRSLKGFLFHFSNEDTIHFYRLSHSTNIKQALGRLTCGDPLEEQAEILERNDVGFNLLVHSFRALSTLRCSGLRTASAAAKPCQGDSLEVYLIIGRIPTVAAAGKRHVNSQPHAHTSYF